MVDTTFDRDFPCPGSDGEIAAFNRLKAKLPNIYTRLANDRRVPHTTVVIPSLSLDQSELSKVEGHMFYEERLLCMLMLLKRPRTRIVFVSSNRIHPLITQYYLNFLTGVPFGHAMRRLIMLDCGDTSPKPLTQKILESPWLIDRMRKYIGDRDRAHMVVFNTTPLERTLSVRLGIPVYGTDPALHYHGSKTGCRRILKSAGIPIPYGHEDLRDQHDIVNALDDLWQVNPDIRRAVVKLNEGFSGKGNAMFYFDGIKQFREAGQDERRQQIAQQLHHLRFESKDETWPRFEQQFRKLHGIVETYIEGENKDSPSVQARVNAIGEPQVISTHDQIMGGPNGQVFMGCWFPARRDYRKVLQEDGLKVANVLSTKGVIGRFAVDFIVVPTANGFERYAIEINLRRGGTTHPFLMMKFLIEGDYNEEKGIYVSNSGQEKYYLATDNLLDPQYIGMGPEDLIDVAVYHDLHYHTVEQDGVAFHMIGSLSQFGKLGITCIANTREQTKQLHQQTISVLDGEADQYKRKDRMSFYLGAPPSNLKNIGF